MIGSLASSGLGFGLAFTLVDQFSNTAAEIERSMSRLEQNAEAMQLRVNNALNQMKIGAAALGVGLVALAPFVRGAKIQAEFEQAEIGLTTLLKSSEKAHAVFEQMKKDAAVTPFQTKDLLTANQAIISQGIDAERSRGVVLNLGNALSAMGRGSADLGSMAVNLQQIAATGKASAIDMKQFAMRGINMYALVADATGKTVEQLQDMPITFEMIEKALAKASAKGGAYEGAMEAMSKSVSGKMSTLQDNIDFTFASMGKAIEPVTHWLLDMATRVLEKLQAFAESPVGAFVFRLVAILGILATVLGVVMIISGGTKFALYKLADAFGATTRAAIVDAIATGGATAGFSAMATAVWAAIAPMIPFIAIGLAVGLAIYGIVKVLGDSSDAFKGYSDSLANGVDKNKLVVDWMTKLGGVLEGISQIWNSWNGKTFEIDTDTFNALKEMGIEDTVLNIGTWLVRLKTFFSGLWEGIKAGFMPFIQIMSTLWNGLKTAVTNTLNSLGIDISANMSKLEEWANVGKAVGIVIGVVLAAIALNFVIMGISAVIAMLPIILVLAAIGLAIWAVMKYGDDLVQWFNKLDQKVMGLVTTGKNIVMNLWNGMKSMMSQFLSWVDEQISSIPIIGDIYGVHKFVGGKIADGVQNVMHSFDNPNANPAPVPVNTNGGIAMRNADNVGKRQGFGANNYFNPNINVAPPQVYPTILLDSEPIAAKIKEKEAFNESRR